MTRRALGAPPDRLPGGGAPPQLVAIRDARVSEAEPRRIAAAIRAVAPGRGNAASPKPQPAGLFSARPGPTCWSDRLRSLGIWDWRPARARLQAGAAGVAGRHPLLAHRPGLPGARRRRHRRGGHAARRHRGGAGGGRRPHPRRRPRTPRRRPAGDPGGAGLDRGARRAGLGDRDHALHAGRRRLGRAGAGGAEGGGRGLPALRRTGAGPAGAARRRTPWRSTRWWPSASACPRATRSAIGEARLRVAGLVRAEPDKVATPAVFGPRALITLDALAATRLLQPGSLVQHDYRIRLPPGASAPALRVRPPSRLRRRRAGASARRTRRSRG